MRRLFSNRYVEALIKTIFFFGILHLAVLSVLALQGDLRVLNAFVILNLDAFHPGLGQGLPSFILSYIMVLVVYGTVLYFSRKSR